MIEKLAYMHEDAELGLVPSKYLSFDLYVLRSNKEICRTNNHDLFLFFKKHYSKKYKSFDIFLNAVLNNHLVLIKKPNYWYSLKLDLEIEKEYSSLGFDKFLKKFSKISFKKGELELNKSIIKSDQYSTISYLLYLNRYDISFDDPHVRYSIIKREDYFE
ncbi:hypothetical protein ACHRVZ_08700 [Flavobacterium sp. FlaQc-57]|uniref:hypothetical protein n=1 Tax=Flavobacterium sp. FlaQc-57 TaxID=3374186 RepID=UPI00375668CE